MGSEVLLEQVQHDFSFRNKFIIRFPCGLQNAVSFIILTYLVPVLFTFYLEGVLKLKK